MAARLRPALPSRAWRPPDRAARRIHKPHWPDPATNAVYMTFDDGPDPFFTSQIADVLEKHGHRGTFFFTGTNARRYPEIVTRVHRAGHGVGSHSARHLKQWQWPAPIVLADCLAGHLQVRKAAGAPIHLYRPPYGHYDWRAAAFARLVRARVVLWTIDPKDWQKEATANQIQRTLDEELRSGAIVLFHDTVLDNPEVRDRSHTLESVEWMSEMLASRGFRGEPIGATS